MNILYVASESSEYVSSLCQEIAKRGHTITMVVQESDHYTTMKEELHSNIKKIVVESNALFHPQLLESLLKEKDVFNDDYDIMFGSNTPIAPVLNYFHSILKIPWGIMIHDVPIDLIDADETRGLYWKFWLADLRSASQVCFNTYVARDEYLNLTNIYYTDDNVFTYATNISKEVSMSGSMVKGDYVVSVCRIAPHKNLSMITKALAYLNNPIKQVVIGRDSGDLHSVMSVAKEHGVEVIVKGMVSDEEKISLIQNSLCLVYPQKSAYIAGLSPWESMMIGKPTICSDYKILRDLYKNHVSYFDVNSIMELAGRINEVYTGDYNIPKLQFASDYAYEEASFSTMATKLLKIMSNIKGD